MDFTASEEKILQIVQDAGALTTRYLITQQPKPNWQRLIDRKILQEYHTIYGAVIGLGRSGYNLLISRQPFGEDVPYLMAPGSVADRAYQMDAVRNLMQEGYRPERYRYRASSQRDETGHRQYTDQITRITMRVPEDQLPGASPRPDAWGLLAEVRGYPALYASISGGGLTLAQVRKLAKLHEFNAGCWRHPLMLVVPDDQDIRGWIRKKEAERQAAHEANLGGSARTSSPYVPRFRIIVQPLPD